MTEMTGDRSLWSMHMAARKLILGLAACFVSMSGADGKVRGHLIHFFLDATSVHTDGLLGLSVRAGFSEKWKRRASETMVSDGCIR